ncbi:TonB-dependent receptor [Gelidibacter salicanalis]|uniref:TonB-dependent receptor n=1 Tax=Gelidibacter salicanalis TaxID=291193 RepID=A0A5C7AQU0_9FLAO|nr:TonB-dependent receptor [Gelidibacter salicanalis]TXE10354.1 TonB-dependent receptor [Gelidibacter salicanalis]
MERKFNGIFTLLLVFLVQLTFAQQKAVSGTVTDEEGLPLVGVTVQVQGTNLGALTDFDGNYAIQASVGQILIFKYVGFAMQQIPVSSSSTINVTMLTDTAALEEVIIMGYISKRKDDMTGSAVQLSSEELQQTTTVSIDQALQGKVAGLNVSTSSGTPGATADIRIRGRSSITAGNSPLYVIDGVPIINENVSGSASGSSLSALASLNTNDISSITVLKDASSTAAYGARGANGVIVITTKDGVAGKTTFNVSSSFGFSNDAIDGPVVLTAAEREMLFYESLFNSYGASNGFTKEGAKQFYLNNLNSFGNDYVVWNEAGRPEGNWANVITNNNAPIQEHNISATGGGEDHNFYASVGYFDQEATVIGSDFKRVSGSLNFTKNFNDKLSFSTSNTASHSYQDGTLEGSAYFSSPRAVKFFMPPTYQPYNNDGSINLDTNLPNPLWVAQNDIDTNRLTRILSNNSITWQTPVENLSFSSRASIDYRVSNYKRYRNRISGDGSGTNGYGYQSHTSSTSYVFQNRLDYKWLTGLHSFDFTVLQEFQKNRRYLLEADGEEFGTDGLSNLASAGSPTLASSEYTDWAVASYMGTASYSFQNTYVLNGTYRREGNSRFSPQNRWGDFYSVGAAYNLHRASFFDVNENINMLKLRASYGVTGNANIGLNNYQVLFGYSSNYTGTAAAFPAQYGNDDLTWETSHTLDLGIDFAFFENRLDGSLAYYSRESKNLLLDVPLSLTTGFVEQTKNIGRMSNKGFELELSYAIVRSDDFNLSLGGNLATNKNEVLELAKDAAGEDITITTVRQRVEVGHPAYAWYMPTWSGVNPNTGVDEWYLNGTDGETTTTFNQAAKAFQGGSALPELTAGLTFPVDYKGFFIDASGFYQGGHKIYESWHLYTHQGNAYSLNLYQGINTVLDRWQNPGDVTRYAKVQDSYEPWKYNSKFLFDGAFARLRNLTFGYDFSEQINKAAGINSGRIYIRGTNLLTWVKDDNLVWDPEVNASGFTDMFTPPTKSVIVGVNFNF